MVFLLMEYLMVKLIKKISKNNKIFISNEN